MPTPDPLTALSPLDGRYASHTAALGPYFSESALIRYRVQVEVEYLIALLPLFGQPAAANGPAQTALRASYQAFQLADARAIKAHEATLRHDVKAVEYWVKARVLAQLELAPAVELVHFGLTSEDVNNLAYGLMQRDALAAVLLPAIARVLAPLAALAGRHRALAMLARTHGQPATPTTLGKELGVFAARLASGLEELAGLPLPGKLNGATGTFGAMALARPDVDWPAFSRAFVSSLGLVPTALTTQIEPRDGYARLYHALVRVNNILLDLAQDLWRYVSDGYLAQAVRADEVGSSAMPHKINPIDFENAEGNLGLANALLIHLADKLVKSRLQRDLSDSTVLRNVGVAWGHTLLACQSLARGLERVDAAPQAIAQDLARHPEVLAEAIQAVMRADGHEAPYEAMKALTRGQSIDLAALRQAAEALAPDRAALWQTLTPEAYVGVAPALADEAVAAARRTLDGLSKRL